MCCSVLQCVATCGAAMCLSVIPMSREGVYCRNHDHQYELVTNYAYEPRTVYMTGTLAAPRSDDLSGATECI